MVLLKVTHPVHQRSVLVPSVKVYETDFKHIVFEMEQNAEIQIDDLELVLSSIQTSSRDLTLTLSNSVEN